MRVAPVIAAVAVALLAVACASTPPVPASPTPVALRPVTVSPIPTPVPAPATLTPASTLPPDEGNVDGATYPELTVEPVDATTLRVILDDPAAKAWRLDIAGTGDLADDHLVVVVETNDVSPTITATEIRDGKVVDEMDLSGFSDKTAAAGGCHATLGVCIDSDGFRLPRNGNGRFAVRLGIADAATPFTITGSSAGWPGEPFILGPWVAADPFTWGAG